MSVTVGLPPNANSFYHLMQTSLRISGILLNNFPLDLITLFIFVGSFLLLFSSSFFHRMKLKWPKFITWYLYFIWADSNYSLSRYKIGKPVCYAQRNEGKWNFFFFFFVSLSQNINEGKWNFFVFCFFFKFVSEY